MMIFLGLMFVVGVILLLTPYKPSCAEVEEHYTTHAERHEGVVGDGYADCSCCDVGNPPCVL